jgi:DHA2 family multidrug resistance protein
MDRNEPYLGIGGADPTHLPGSGRVGTRLFVLGSVLVFSWASLVCVQAPNSALPLIFRAFQGLGGEILIPLQLIILARAAGPERLARVLTISMGPILLAPICGPILGD